MPRGELQGAKPLSARAPLVCLAACLDEGRGSAGRTGSCAPRGRPRPAGAPWVSTEAIPAGIAIPSQPALAAGRGSAPGTAPPRPVASRLTLSALSASPPPPHPPTFPPSPPPRSYRLTGGSKFGADFLVYPGDPSLYHAQFCVRLLPFRQPILPAMLASATRGSHQARKHLLIASVVEEAAAAAGAGAGAPDSRAAASGSDEQRGQQPQAQEQQQQQQPVQALGGGGGVQLGADSRGVGSHGERFRIRYLTIGPVEGFG